MHSYLSILIIITFLSTAVFLYLNRKRRIVCLIFVALVLISVVVDVSTLRRYPASPKSRTLAIINSVRFGITQMEVRQGIPIVELVRHSTNLNETITLLLLRNEIIERKLVSSNSFICVTDAWGTPLQVMFRNDLKNKANDFVLFRNNTNSVIIWSSGPNKTNEYGRGDDVLPQ